jgi:hypothetical protein
MDHTGLRDDSEVGLVELPLTHSKKDPMLFDTSDAVVVGVTVGQSYLSNDRRDIYSEFKVKLGEITQNSNTVYLRANDSIDIQRKDGAIRGCLLAATYLGLSSLYFKCLLTALVI